MTTNQQIKVIIAGGGTGGHIFPAIAIAHALQETHPGVELLFVGANGRMEMEKIPQEGFRIIGLDIAGFNRSNLLKNITLPWKLIKSAFKARSIINSFKPNIVIGVGGYASFPMLNAAQRIGIPTLIQEQNSHAGKSNLILGKKAVTICAAYQEVKNFFNPDKVVLTGNPVRKLISNSNCTKEDGIAFFNLNKNQKTVLIVGGSLGAQSINKALISNISTFSKLPVQFIWQTGKGNVLAAQAAVNGREGQFKVFEFIREMDMAYAAADIIISRAGAMAIAELCIVGKPVIFVPYPFAAEDHQTKNAMALVNKGAALCISNQSVNEELLPILQDLVSNDQKQQELGTEISKLGIKDADFQIPQIVNNIISNHHGHQ